MYFIALPAFISSLHSTSELVGAVLLNVHHLATHRELELAEEVWELRVGAASLAEDADRCRQKTWNMPLVECSRDRLLNAADQVSRARLLASSCREGGLWLQALPVPSLGTLLDSETFQIAVALRVGAEANLAVFPPATTGGCMRKKLSLGTGLPSRRGNATERQMSP